MADGCWVLIFNSLANMPVTLQDAVDAINVDGAPLSVRKGKKWTIVITVDDTQLVFVETSGRKKTVSTVRFHDLLFANGVGPGMIHIAAMVPPHAVQKTSGVMGCLPIRRSGKPSATFKDRILLEFHITAGEVQSRPFIEALNQTVFGTSTIPVKKALVVVNPVAGKAHGRSDWTNKVEPVLRASRRFDYEVMFTERRGHGFEIGFDKLGRPGEREYDCVITLGGDGVMFEIINGLYLHHPDRYASILKSLVLCPLPSGSGNGVCFSALCLAGEPFTMNCALRQLIRFNTTEKDLGVVHYPSTNLDEPESVSRLFSLTLSWGLVADVDIKSEVLRKSFGDSRFTIYGVLEVVRRTLRGGQLIWTPDGQEIEPDFLTVYATLVPVAGRTVILSPSKGMAEGHFNIYRLRGKDCSRVALVEALTELEVRREHADKIAGFDAIHTSSFELIPDSNCGGAGIVVDGEALTPGPVRVELLPCATRCLTD